MYEDSHMNKLLCVKINNVSVLLADRRQAAKTQHVAVRRAPNSWAPEKSNQSKRVRSFLRHRSMRNQVKVFYIFTIII